MGVENLTKINFVGRGAGHPDLPKFHSWAVTMKTQRPKSVIPAKAGIHALPTNSHSVHPWIPAFAGMTVMMAIFSA